MKKRWLIICFAFFIGLILILIPVLSNLKAKYIENKIISDFTKNKSENNNKDRNDEEKNRNYYEYPIALIKIQSINLEAPIVEGENNINYTVGKYTNSAEFGYYGNVILAAHNNMAGSIFKNLEDVSIGDSVTIETKKNIFTYKITTKNIVKPTDSDILKEDINKKEITLITCANNAKNRLIVRGEILS